MIRDLLTPEAHRDPYVWAAVLLAHGSIGAMGWVLIGWWVVLVYALFELAQAAISRRLLIWDMALDWTAVTLGAAMIAWLSGWAVVALMVVAGVGYWRRAR